MPSFFRPRFRVLSGALLLLTTLTRGQEAPLRLSDALARALDRNPRLSASAHSQQAADALIEQAAQRPAPTLDIQAENFAGTGTRQGLRQFEATVQASQPIERGGKRERRVAVATRDRDVAAQEHAVKRAEVLAAAAVAFVEALAAQHRVALAEEPVKFARDFLASTEGRLRAGVASAAEPARARAALSAARGDLARAQSELVAARARLAATWGGTAAEVTTLQGTLQIPEALHPESALLEKLPAHPRLSYQQALVAARQAAVDLERGQAAQDITVAGGVRFLREGSDAALVAGVSVPLPARHRSQGAIRAARENLSSAEEAVRATERELRTAFTTAWQEALAASAAARSLRTEVIPASQEAHAVVRRAFEQGQLPLIDVLDAQRDLLALRRELLELEVRFAIAHARAEALADPTLPLTSTLLSLP